MITTVFSSTDSPAMQWQSELLEHSWRAVGQPGCLVRLVATARPDVLPRHRFARSVATRLWDQLPGSGEPYPVYNKPASLLEWLYRERPEGTLLLLDPDCVFRAPLAREVSPGQAVGQRWVDARFDPAAPLGFDARFEPLLPFCADPALRPDPVMIPHLIHARDLTRIVLRWAELTRLIRQQVSPAKPMWESDMFALLVASAEVGLRHEPAALGIAAGWPAAAAPDSPLIHYCQPIRDPEGEVLWSKHRYRPWSRIEDPSRAAEPYGRELLELINAFVDGRSL